MGLEEKLPDGVLLASVEKLVNWTRKSSLWPVTFGLACCAIEMMTFGAPRFDSARFGMEVFRPSPRQADLMIVAGRVSQKMAPVLRQIYDQMAEPRWVIAMGVCASSGGMFNNYAIVQGVDHVVPVDMYLPGCPPRPEMLIDAILKLHHKIMNEPLGPEAGREAGRPEGRADPVSRRGTPNDADPSEDPGTPAGEPAEVRRRRPARSVRCRADQQRPGMFGVTGSGDTSGFSGLQRQPWVELPARATLRRLLRRGRRRASGGLPGRRAGDPQDRRRPRRADPLHRPRAHRRGRASVFATTRRCASSCVVGVRRRLPGPRRRGRRAAARRSTT